MSVPIRTNPELRKSRLFHSMFGYVKKSMITILRSFLMYKPLKFFGMIGTFFTILGSILGIRFIVYLCMGEGSGHVQSLILVAIFLLTGVISYLIGLQADVIAANRKILASAFR